MKKGTKMTIESRKKIGEKTRGENNPMFGVRITGEKHHFYGKHHTQKAKEKNRVAHIGKTAWNKGKKIGNGSSTSFKKGQIPWNKGLKGFMAGATNGRWKGGATPKNQKIRTSTEYKLWRKSVFERDNYACIWCGARSGNGKTVVLNADHIKPFAHFPELRFAIDNGRTLCVPCHKTTDNFAGRGLKRLKKDLYE